MLAADQKFLDGCDADVADLENGMWPEAAQAARCAKRMVDNYDRTVCLFLTSMTCNFISR